MSHHKGEGHLRIKTDVAYILGDYWDVFKDDSPEKQEEYKISIEEHNVNATKLPPIIVTESVSDNVRLTVHPLSPLTPEDPINVKFKQIMDTLEIKEDIQISMKNWDEEKKIQMILQYDFLHKGQQLITQKQKKKHKHKQKQDKPTKTKRKSIPHIQLKKKRKSFQDKQTKKKRKSLFDFPKLKKNNKAKSVNDIDNSANNPTKKTETLHTEDVESKFEEVMEKVEIPKHARKTMKKLKKDKKNQMITQYEKMTKSKFVTRLQRFSLFKSKSSGDTDMKSQSSSNKTDSYESKMPNEYKPSLSTGVYGSYCIDINKSISINAGMKKHVYKPSLSTGIYGGYALNAVDVTTKWSSNDVNNAITKKFTMIMDMVQIADKNRQAMREWSDEKKIQMIMQYEYYAKSKSLNKSVVNSDSEKPRKNSLFKSFHRKLNKTQKTKNKTVQKPSEKMEQCVKKPSEGNVPQSNENVISTKFEQIMESAHIPQNSRVGMRKWNDEKKIKLIMQYEFMENIKKGKLGTKKKNSKKKQEFNNIQQIHISAPMNSKNVKNNHMYSEHDSDYNKLDGTWSNMLENSQNGDEIEEKTDIDKGKDEMFHLTTIKQEIELDESDSDDFQPPLIFSMASDTKDDNILAETHEEHTSYLLQ